MQDVRLSQELKGAEESSSNPLIVQQLKLFR